MFLHNSRFSSLSTLFIITLYLPFTFKNNYYDKEDLFQIGCIGLMKAINNFDTNSGL